MTGPARLTRRRFWASVRTDDASTSNTASTRVSVFWACWPPGPLEREKRRSISPSGSSMAFPLPTWTRSVSAPMTAILLDIDGVLHVSGEAIPGAPEALVALREGGHPLRLVTNNTTRARWKLAAELRSLGIDVAEDEISTTPLAAGRLLAGLRVLALTMDSVREDLERHVT